MGFTLSQNKFKSASFVFSKIKRELKSLGAVSMFDDADFALYTAEVLKELGCGTYKESEVLLTVHNGKAQLPKDFMWLYAAYKCHKCTDEPNELHFQRGYFVQNDITCEILGKTRDCKLGCDEFEQVLQRVTVREYVGNDICRTRAWNDFHLLHPSPNVKECCVDDSPNLHCSGMDEITFTNGCAFVNFKKADIFLQYYAFPLDEDNVPLIPDVLAIEKCVEWKIKYELMLNFWFDGSVPDIQNKWNKAEQMYHDALATARYDRKLPSFQQMINTARNKRSINILSYFGNYNR